jgi:hypothetical protein
VTDNTDGPTGQDRSADGRPPKSIGDLLRIAYSAAGKAESMGIRRMELERLVESMPDLADAIKSMPRETSGQDVAALRAEVERLKADDLVRRVAYSELASVNAFLREQLATVTRERDAYERQSCAQAAELLDARKEIATARERIAALEAASPLPADWKRTSDGALCEGGGQIWIDGEDIRLRVAGEPRWTSWPIAVLRALLSGAK